jgi:general stress protein YciG
VPDEKRSFSQNPELAAEAGRKGGQASHGGGNTDGQAKAAAPRTPGQGEE